MTDASKDRIEGALNGAIFSSIWYSTAFVRYVSNIEEAYKELVRDILAFVVNYEDVIHENGGRDREVFGEDECGNYWRVVLRERT